MTPFLGPYELRGRLGSGAMAVVWRAWDPKLEREVAVKEPVRSPTTSDSFAAELAERFVREGKTAARLAHPGIVTIYAADVFDGRPAIVMELLRGQMLSELIDRRSLTYGAVVSILDQLLDALDYAHAMGVVHRDVKPDNVFVLEDGRVKLTDFGVAHVSRLEGATATVVAGTPGYMAPEQVLAGPVDGRADIFGIGAIAYEMLAGYNPFGATEGAETTTIMYRTTSGPEIAFESTVAAPPAIQQVVLKALARNPDGRFATAGEMRSQLRSAAAALSMEGTAAVAVLVDSSATQFATSLSGATLDTLNAVTRKGSGVNMAVTAIAASVGVIVLIALVFTPATTDIGLLLTVALAISGAAWWMMRHKRAAVEAPEAEADLFGRAAEPAGDATGAGTAFRVRGTNEDRVVRTALPCVIGRSGDVQLSVDDDLVSRRHAMLEYRADRIWVVDLSSRNGTFLDGVPVRDAAPLLPGSVVTVGSTEVSVAS